jgi:hypothetical protein
LVKARTRAAVHLLRPLPEPAARDHAVLRAHYLHLRQPLWLPVLPTFDVSVLVADQGLLPGLQAVLQNGGQAAGLPVEFRVGRGAVRRGPVPGFRPAALLQPSCRYFQLPVAVLVPVQVAAGL